ncbi:MAG: cold shock and DUF1294 domain-containing protein [Proteobacteria bacterium]|nr:cold shock and DUF1294 domain-containing protein [Pseudomonadota bacterium]MBU1058992.1 cold shock and DUF1294 domain-containing protein [Pseudomonadota bacterium]
MSIKGKITSWNDEKGFGFITPLTKGERVFVHITSFSNRNRRPEVNQMVTYTLSSDTQGRPCVGRAALVGDPLRHKREWKRGLPSIVAAVFFLGIVGASVLAAKLPPLIFIFYIATSALTFIIYAADKSAARKGAWRTQESTLHVLALAGGWPGALVAQQKLRHKSQKQSFRAVFWLTVFLNCAAFVWLFTPSGSTTLQSLITDLMPRLTALSDKADFLPSLPSLVNMQGR